MPLSRIDLLPSGAAEALRVPYPLPVTEICIPADAGPIKFKPLNVELGSNLLAIERRSDIRPIVEKPA